MSIKRLLALALMVPSQMASVQAQSGRLNPSVPIYLVSKDDTPATLFTLLQMLQAESLTTGNLSSQEEFLNVFRDLHRSHLARLPLRTADSIEDDKIVVLPAPENASQLFGWVVCDEVKAFTNWATQTGARRISEQLESELLDIDHSGGQLHTAAEPASSKDHHHVYALNFPSDPKATEYILWYAREARNPRPLVLLNVRIPAMYLNVAQTVQLEQALKAYQSLTRP